MGNTSSSSGDGPAPPPNPGPGKPAGRRKVAKRASNEEGKEGGGGPPRLIIEKRLDGISMVELQKTMQELTSLKNLIQETKAKEEEEEEEEDDDHLPLLEKISRKFKKAVDDDSPVNEQLKRKLSFGIQAAFWLTGKAAFVAMLAYFTYAGISASQKLKNISLDSSCTEAGCTPRDSSSPFRLCLSVPNAITAQYVLDMNGFWAGTMEFLDGVGMYTFTFNAFSKSDDEYTAFMQNAKAVIQSVADGSKYRTIHENLIYGMSWTYLYPDGENTQKIQLQPDPAYVFNRFYKSAALGTSTVQCYADPTIRYDKNTGDVAIIYDYGTVPTCTSLGKSVSCSNGGSGYIGLGDSNTFKTGCCTSPTCDPKGCKTNEPGCALVPNDFGYKEAFDPIHFTIKYNIRSLITALGVNLGITPYEGLSKVSTAVTSTITGCYDLVSSNKCFKFAANGSASCTASSWGLSFNKSSSSCSIKVKSVEYTLETRMDSQYPGMDPIYCLLNATEWQDGQNSSPQPTVCMLRAGRTFIYPYYSHMGSSQTDDFYSWTKGCWCKKPDFPSTYSDFYSGTYPTTNARYNGETSSYCNKFDFVHGGIMFKGDSYDSILGYMVIMDKLYTAQQINNMAYMAGFATVKLGGAAGRSSQKAAGPNAPSKDSPSIYTQDALKSRFYSGSNAYNTTGSKCTGAAYGNCPGKCTTTNTNVFSFATFNSGVYDPNGDGSCYTSPTILAVNTYDEIDQRVNAVGVVVPTASCNDYIGIQDGSWDDGNGKGAVNVPPTKLIQDYYECYNTIMTSVMISFGSASGTASSISPLFLLIVVWAFAKFFVPKQRAKEATKSAHGHHSAHGANADAEAAPDSAPAPALAPAPAPAKSWFGLGRRPPAAPPSGVELVPTENPDLSGGAYYGQGGYGGGDSNVESGDESGFDSGDDSGDERG